MPLGQLIYLLLALSGGVLIWLAYHMCPDVKLFVLYAGGFGITLFFDYFVAVLGRAYMYAPGFLNSHFDSYIGGMINSHILPSAALLFVVLRGSFWMSTFLAAMFWGVEMSFLYSGVYIHTWWQTGITFVVLIFYFPVFRKWWEKLRERKDNWVAISTLAMGGFGLRIMLAFISYGLLEIRSYHIYWFEHRMIDGSAINTPLFLCMVFWMSVVVVRYSSMKHYALPLVAFTVIDTVMHQMGHVQSSHWIIDSCLFALFNVATLLLLIGFNHWRKQTGPTEAAPSM